MSFIPLQPLLLYATGVQVIHTGDTSLTTLDTYTVKANMMGVKDMLELFYIFSCNNNANVKTPSITIGGSSVMSLSLANQASIARGTFWQNRNSLSSQSCNTSSGNGTFGSIAAKVSTAINTAADFVINFNCTLTNAADNIAIEQAQIYMWRFP